MNTPLQGSKNRVNLRDAAMRPEDDTDPTPNSGPNSTDPIFPPKLGRAGPTPVRVTAVQGPGVDAEASEKETTTTERLSSGLLSNPSPDVKQKKTRKRE